MGWMDGWMDGMDGWVDGWLRRFKDCLQQITSNVFKLVHKCKLRQFHPKNQIVDDSDSKLSKFDR